MISARVFFTLGKKVLCFMFFIGFFCLRVIAVFAELSDDPAHPPISSEKPLAYRPAAVRNTIIDKEFKCIREQLNRHKDFEWQEVCYSNEDPAEPNSRVDMINKALDQAATELEKNERTSEELKSYSNQESQPRSSPSRRTDSSKTPISNPDVEEKETIPSYDYSKPYSWSDSWKTPNDEHGIRGFEFQFDIEGGYRVDNLVWNIAGDISGCCPNILSELTWDDLYSYQLKSKAKMVFNDALVVDGVADYGFILDGDNQDSDYLGNDRTLEFSRSNNNAEDGNVLDFTGGLGYRFHFWGSDAQSSFAVDEAWVTPLGGYSYHEQNLTITDGLQTIPPTGSFPGLNSSYETEWKGPWVGFEVDGRIEKVRAMFRFEYHWADYLAEANWNLRDDFAHPKSFEHIADGTGVVFTFQGAYDINDHWSISLTGDIQDWETDPGIDRTFFSDGTVIDTRLNVVEWNSFDVMFGTTYRFGP